MTVESEIEYYDIADELASEMTADDLADLLSRIIQRKKKNSKEADFQKEVADLLKKELGYTTDEGLKADNLIDHFKVQAFQDAMDKYSLEEIEYRLK